MLVSVNKIKNSEQHKVEDSSGKLDLVSRQNLFKAKRKVGVDGLTDRVKAEIYGELHLLLSTGLDMKRALHILQNDSNNKTTRLVNKIEQAVLEGKSLSLALESSGKFTQYELMSVKIGEETGTLPEILKELNEYFTSKIELRRKILSAISYPALVLLSSIAAVVFMLEVVVPMFEDVFRRFNGELPWLTKKVIELSKYLADYGWGFVIGVLAVALVLYFKKSDQRMRKWGAIIVLNIPYFGNMVKASYIAKFASSFYLLTASRQPLLQSLILVRQMISFYPIEECLIRAESDLIGGKSLSSSLMESKFFPAKMIGLIEMGEEVNQLSTVFNKIQIQYKKELEYKAGLLNAVLEPMLIIFIGVMVGFILIAMYLPLFELSSGVGM